VPLSSSPRHRGFWQCQNIQFCLATRFSRVEHPAPQKTRPKFPCPGVPLRGASRPRARAMATPVNYQAINDAESGANPPVPWADGTLDCFSDCEVCLWGCLPCGCYQSLFAWNARDAGTEDFHPALFRVLGLTIVVPNLLGFAASAAPSLAPAVQPLSTANQLLFAWYGMTHRQKMRRRHNIKGTDSGLCNCFACLCEGDEEKIEDFCCYLCCAPVSKLSLTPDVFPPRRAPIADLSPLVCSARRARRRDT